MADRPHADPETQDWDPPVAEQPRDRANGIPDSAGDAVAADPGRTQREGAATGPDPTAPAHAEHDAALVGSTQPQVAEGAVITEDVPPVTGAGLRSGSGRFGDRFFFGLTAGASGFVTLVVVLVAVFLLWKSLPSIAHDKVSFFTSFDWSTTPSDLRFGIPKLLWVTVIISVLALLFAVPLAVGIALFTTQYAPRRMARPIGQIIDLLAAIPSIIYGIWGAYVLSPELTPVQNALSHLGFIPLFTAGYPTGTIFNGGVILAVMILPIVTAISRDVFDRVPNDHIEAALALGATRWEMIRMAVLPYGRPGVISGSMLGLGRALGETLAVLLIVHVTSQFNFSLFNGGETFASKIANNSAEFGLNPGPYLAAGLVLFVLTFIVNAIARIIVERRRAFS